MKQILCAFGVFICLANIQAQLNIKVGYGLSYANPNLYNEITDTYNTQQTELTQSFKDIRFLHGMTAGLRYRIEDIGIEATWTNKYNTIRSSGTDLAGDDISRELLFRIGSYGLGMEAYVTKTIGLGASFDLENYRLRTDVADIDNRYTVLSEWGYGSHFYISFNLSGGDLLTLSIKPFVQIPWSNINLSNFNTELNTTTPNAVPPDYYQERFMNFGIQFVFYNGQW